MTDGDPIFFKTSSEFRSWLAENGETQDEIWVGYYKKNSGKSGMNYAAALDEALCFGWIDGLAKSVDNSSYKQRYTPRRAKSVWSKINTDHVARLIREGRMTPAGMAAVTAAKKDGRWERAYDPPSAGTLPEYFLKELSGNKKAEVFYRTLSSANRYAIAYRLQNAVKEETKRKRASAIIAMLARRETFH